MHTSTTERRCRGRVNSVPNMVGYLIRYSSLLRLLTETRVYHRVSIFMLAAARAQPFDVI